MPGSIFNRVKTWISETITAADLNAEFDNILDNLDTEGLGGYSANEVEMQQQVDPGEPGSPNLAVSVADELAHLRHQIAELKGTTYWYSSPGTNLQQLLAAVGGGLPDNRLVSGATSVNSQFPLFLDPGGTTDTATLLATATDFIYNIESTQYTLSADVAIENLVAAPNSNNTALLNDASLTGDPETRYSGEYGTKLIYDTAGSEITNLNGKIAAFSVNNGVDTEYFLARVDDTNSQLVDCKRGYFFDSSLASIPRITVSDNDTLTLMSLAWVYVKTDGTIALSYTNPVINPVEPASPAANDYWFDTVSNKWKRFDSAIFVDADAMLVGLLITNSSDDCVGARSFEFFLNHSPQNSILLEYVSATQIRTARRNNWVQVYGNAVRIENDYIIWDITTDLEAGVSESASAFYYVYLTTTGEPKLSNIAPYDRTGDLYGYYHPNETWRYIGVIQNDTSSDFDSTSLRNAPENQSEHIITYTSAGTSDWIMQPGLRNIEVTVVGGGGGAGGAASASSQSAVSGGGGGGGASIAYVKNTELGAQETVTVGAAGGGGNSSGVAGASGGTSSFGSFASGAGGGGGDVQASGTASLRGGTPGIGGAGSLGDVNIPGGTATWGFREDTPALVASNGGDSMFGAGGLGNSSIGAGSVGRLYGGGGGGSTSFDTTNVVGGSGAVGIVVLKERYK